MARTRSKGKRFDVDTMRALVALEEQVDEHLPDEQTFVGMLREAGDAYMSAQAEALVAYHATELTDDEQKDLAKQRKDIAKHKKEHRRVSNISPAALKSSARWKEEKDNLNSILAIAAAQATWLAEVQELIDQCSARIGELENAALIAGVSAFNSEKGISGNSTQGTYPAVAGTVYQCRFATEQKVYFLLCHKWSDYTVYIKDEKTETMSFGFSFKEMDVAGSKAFATYSAVRKLAHVHLRGWEHGGVEYKGTIGIAALCDGTLPLGKVNAGGIGHNKDLTVDVGCIRDWLAAHADELKDAPSVSEEPETEEATVESA